MTRRIRSVLFFVGLGTLGVLLMVFHPQAEEVEEERTPTVSESDLQMYIKVYSAMQEDHDLTIENAIKPHNISLDAFRQIERRIQSEPRMVERVRQALLDYAKEHSAFAQAPTPTAPAAGEPQPAPKKDQHRKKK